MSSEQILSQPVAKKVSLSSKYDRVISTVFWTMRSLNQNGILVGDAYDSAIDMMHLKTTDVDDQTTFFETFFENLSDLKKELKVLRKGGKKVVTKRTKQNKNDEAEEGGVGAKKPARGRKAKTVEIVRNVQDELIGKLVALANGEPTQTMDQVEPTQTMDQVEPTQTMDQVEPAQTMDQVIQNECLIEPLTEPVIVPALTEVKTKKRAPRKPKSAKEPIVTEPIVEPVTEPIVAAVTEVVTEPVTEPIVEAVTEPVVEAVTEPIVEDVKTKKRAPRKTKSAKEPIVIEPVIVEPIVEDVKTKKRAPRKPKSAKEPVVIEPVVEPVVIEPVVEQVVEPIVVESESESELEAEEEEIEFANLPIDGRNFLVDLASYQDSLVQTCFLFSEDDPDISKPVASFHKISKIVSFL